MMTTRCSCVFSIGALACAMHVATIFMLSGRPLAVDAFTAQGAGQARIFPSKQTQPLVISRHPLHRNDGGNPDPFALRASTRPDDNDVEDETLDPRDNVGRMMRGMISTGISKDTIDSRDVVVAKADIPELGIYTDQTYELRSIYLQGVNPDTEMVERIPLDSLEDNDQSRRPGYTRYIRLFSPMYHEEPVVVTPEEAGLVSLKAEVFDSVRVALPILTFWTTLCIVFAQKYNERYGGDFWDALFGR